MILYLRSGSTSLTLRSQSLSELGYIPPRHLSTELPWNAGEIRELHHWMRKPASSLSATMQMRLKILQSEDIPVVTRNFLFVAVQRINALLSSPPQVLPQCMIVQSLAFLFGSLACQFSDSVSDNCARSFGKHCRESSVSLYI